MKKSDLIWALSEIDEDLVLGAMENHAARKLMKRPLRAVLVAAALLVIFTGTVAGIYAGRHWDEILTEFFHMEEADKERLEHTVQDVYAEVEQDGCIFTIKQIVGDGQFLMVALDIQLPEQVELPMVSAEELKTVAEENGYDWEGVQNRLERYGCFASDGYYMGNVFLNMDSMAPIFVDKETLIEKANEEIAEYGSDYGDDIRSLLGDVLQMEMLEALQLEESIDWDLKGGGGTLYRGYDPETKTLSCLSYMQNNIDMRDRECTLVIPSLIVEPLLESYGTPAEEAEAEGVGTELLSDPVVMHFTANYENDDRKYTIFQGEQEIGTLALTSYSAFVSFPQEKEDTAFESLREAAEAPVSKDYLNNFSNDLSVLMKDGTIVEMEFRSGGVSDDLYGFYIAKQTIDFNKIDNILLSDYTFELQE